MERMTQVQDGGTVMVHYTSKLEGGTVFDITINRDSSQFRIDEGQIIPLFEQAMAGMEPGNSKIIEILADEAYGLYYDELVLTVGPEVFSKDLQPEVNQQFEVRQPGSQSIAAMVTDVTESSATMYANHPLAGKDLIFNIPLLEVVWVCQHAFCSMMRG